MERNDAFIELVKAIGRVEEACSYKEISINSLNVDYRENDDGDVFMGDDSDDFFCIQYVK